MEGAKRLIEDSRALSRRSFLALAGWSAFLVGSAIALFQALRFIFPNATYETPAVVKLGPPSDYAVGSTTVFISERVVINRDPDGIYAFNLICTHLGCTPRSFLDVTSDLVAEGIHSIKDPLTGQAATPQSPALPGFKCPCHGSRYFRDSVNFFGPAPRPMDHIHVEASPDGRLLVDRASFVDLTFRLKV
jgi:cytochrome b6-f complex iron-sulfur subunit